ncbi:MULTISPECIES: hypothetical protein [Rhizobium/Agrobacterium group]|uniref:Uncharacterized protein n=2 Tax=Rhizobium/Agrobacterium group TaxID=227290 RepID=B9JRK2_ALLAM|nr:MULTISPECIES: hypothetical protein [Rhizobium/Agrobacterium group]ACM35479.1 hypothetical protein Avi_0674 [Allorhizobium ampelinum S4]MUO28270.1 hypothetical protein [Agrobacterium vitis]MUO40696.1 hypothetical protein [Agrobacterium vitis]MUP12765.1 hypothetical protein [Agrobacterium vitis]
MESSELDEIAENVRAASERCGSMILETVPAHDALPSVVIDANRFPALIEHLKPRLVYMILTTFDGREDVAAALDVDAEELDRDEKKLADKWTKHNGQTSCLGLGVMHDGIVHAVIVKPDWFEEFEEETEVFRSARHDAINAAFARHQEKERAQREADEKNRLGPVVKKLVADPRFNAPKISAAKRLALAETIFPDLDKASAKKAVDRAANELWLAESGK